MSVNISRDEWLQALGETIVPPDPNAITSAEFAQMIGRGIIAARRRLDQMVADGTAEHCMKLLRRRDGVVQTVAAYRLVKSKGKKR
jgi:hypothetical protein